MNLGCSKYRICSHFNNTDCICLNCRNEMEYNPKPSFIEKLYKELIDNLTR